MQNIATYKLFQTIDIAGFENAYKTVLKNVVSGEREVANEEYKGLLAACDKAYKMEQSEQWKAYYMYLGIMQPVLKLVVEKRPDAREVNAFLEEVNVSHVEHLFEMLKADYNMSEDSVEASEFERYSDAIQELAIIDFAFAYTESGDFLHNDARQNPEGFLGNILLALYVLNCIVSEKGRGLSSTITVRNTSMYGEFFANLDKKEAQAQSSGYEEPEATYEQQANGTRTIDGDTLRWMEQERARTTQYQYEDTSFTSRIKKVCRTLNALIKKWFGKIAVPLFWVALVILYVNEFLIGVAVTVVLYFIGKFMKV